MTNEVVKDLNIPCTGIFRLVVDNFSDTWEIFLTGTGGERYYASSEAEIATDGTFINADNIMDMFHLEGWMWESILDTMNIMRNNVTIQ